MAPRGPRPKLVALAGLPIATGESGGLGLQEAAPFAAAFAASEESAQREDDERLREVMEESGLVEAQRQSLLSYERELSKRERDEEAAALKEEEERERKRARREAEPAPALVPEPAAVDEEALEQAEEDEAAAEEAGFARQRDEADPAMRAEARAAAAAVAAAAHGPHPQLDATLDEREQVVVDAGGRGRCLFLCLVVATARRLGVDAAEFDAVVEADRLRGRAAAWFPAFRDFFEANRVLEDGETFEERLHNLARPRLADPSTWPGSAELYVLAGILRRPIAVYKADPARPEGSRLILLQPYGLPQYADEPTVRLLYDGAHYRLRVPREENEEAAALAAAIAASRDSAAREEEERMRRALAASRRRARLSPPSVPRRSPRPAPPRGLGRAVSRLFRAARALFHR